MACKRVMITSWANKVEKEGPAATALSDCSRARDKSVENEGDDDDCKAQAVIELSWNCWSQLTDEWRSRSTVATSITIICLTTAAACTETNVCLLKMVQEKILFSEQIGNSKLIFEPTPIPVEKWNQTPRRLKHQTAFKIILIICAMFNQCSTTDVRWGKQCTTEPFFCSRGNVCQCLHKMLRDAALQLDSVCTIYL